jgi:hypothetical protein
MANPERPTRWVRMKPHWDSQGAARGPVDRRTERPDPPQEPPRHPSHHDPADAFVREAIQRNYR